MVKKSCPGRGAQKLKSVFKTPGLRTESVFIAHSGQTQGKLRAKGG